jgi:hypothetical protein
MAGNPNAPDLASMSPEQLAKMIAQLPPEQKAELRTRLQAEKVRRAQADDDAYDAHARELFAAGRNAEVDLARWGGGWFAWMIPFREALSRASLTAGGPSSYDTSDPAPPVGPMPRLYKDSEGEFRRVDPPERASIPDQGPTPVAIELNAIENEGAGWPPEIHTRHFVVHQGIVKCCEANGKILGSQQELRHGQDPLDIARGLWTKRLGGDRGPPIKYGPVRYA